MKITVKSILLLAILFVASFSTLQAQRGGGGWNSSPAEMAEKQTTMMNDSLTLSSAQLSKVAEINFKYAKMMSDMRSGAREKMDPDGDRDAMRKQMKEMMTKIGDERKNELKVILTSDQFTKYEMMEENRRKMREERRKNRGDRKRGDRKKGEGKKKEDRS